MKQDKASLDEIRFGFRVRRARAWAWATLIILGGLGTTMPACSRRDAALRAVPDAEQSLGTDRACPAGMVAIPGGTLDWSDGTPAVPIKPFCYDKFEVTVADYRRCTSCSAPVSHHPASPEKGYYWEYFCNWNHPQDRDRHPINCVIFAQAQHYCAQRGARLPTSVEWEWAARSGGPAHTFPWGDEPPDGTQANAAGPECSAMLEETIGIKKLTPLYPRDDGFPATAPVGSFPKGKTSWDLYDLSGNVTEITSTPGWSEGTRVARGGDWLEDFAGTFRTRATDDFIDAIPDSKFGFRCAR